jgi:excisionase family DNA binding protein
MARTRTHHEETVTHQPASPPELLTVSEVAERLRVDDTTVRRWIKSGALDAILLPHRGKRQGYRVKKSTLDALIHGTAVSV